MGNSSGLEELPIFYMVELWHTFEGCHNFGSQVSGAGKKFLLDRPAACLRPSVF